MGWAMAEVENVVYSGDAYGFTGNAQHGYLCPSSVINRFLKDRASAPVMLFVVARHYHRRLHTVPIVHSCRNPDTLGKVQMLAAVVFSFPTLQPSICCGKAVLIVWKSG